MELTAKERAQVKKVSRELLQTLKAEKLALDWRKRQQARAQVRVAIETLLDQGLPEAYTPEYGPLDNASPLPIGRSSDLRSMAMTIDRHGNSQYLFSSKKVNMMVGVLFIFAALGLLLANTYYFDAVRIAVYLFNLTTLAVIFVRFIAKEIYLRRIAP